MPLDGPEDGVRRWRRQQLPRTMTQAQAQSLLEANGWIREKGGKHVVKMTKEGHRPITLPMHRGETYGLNLTHEILKQAGLR